MYKIYLAILLFFYSYCSFGQLSDFGEVKFKRADSIANEYSNHSIEDLSILSYKLTSPLASEVEKFRAVYKWVCENIENDYGFYIKNKKMREKLDGQTEKLEEWNNALRPKVFDKLVKSHQTICTGYAYLIKELAYYAGIESHIVNGYGQTIHANVGGKGIANHSWNSVKLNGKWYLCDATWSSGSVLAGQSNFIKNFAEGYFLASPSLFVQNHYPIDSKWLLMETSPSLSEFLNGPIVYKGALNHEIAAVFPQTFNQVVKKGETLKFRLESKENIDQLTLQIIYSGNTKSYFPSIYRDDQGDYCIDHEFKSKGTYDVHVLTAGDYLFTYTVKVSK